MKFTLSRAAKEAHVSKATLSEALKNGRLSAPKDERGRYQIDPAELFRAFPKRTENRTKKPKPNDNFDRPNNALEREIELLRERIEEIKEDRGQRIEELIADRDRWQEQAAKVTALLEDRRERRGLFGFFKGSKTAA